MKIINKISLLSLLLAAALLFSGCGLIVLVDARSDPEETETPSDTEARGDIVLPPSGSPQKADRSEEFSALADAYLGRIAANGYDFNNATFFIAAPFAEILTPNEETRQYASAAQTRNEKVEKALNVRLAASVVDANTYYDKLKTSILSEEYFADLLLLPAAQIGTFALNGLVLNLNSVPLLDLTQPYFFADSAEAASGGIRTFAVAGHASFETTSLSAVYFNRDLMEKHNLPLPYSRVYDGSWTWDSFFTYCAAVPGINAANAANTENSICSFSYQYVAESLPSLVFASSGEKLVCSEPLKSPVITVSEKNTDILSRIVKLYTEENAFHETDSGVSRFYSGTSLFLLDRLYLMSWMPSSRQNWGILPMPKLSEEQTRYVSLTDSSALFFAIPENQPDTAKASILLSALNAASYGVLTEAYCNYAAGELLRDNESSNMLSIITDSRTYDFALAFSGEISSLREATVQGLSELAKDQNIPKLLTRIPEANQHLADKFPASSK